MSLDPKLSGPVASAELPRASTWLDLQGLRSLATADDPRGAGNVRAVAQQFEQLFLGMMLKSMRDAKLADPALDGEGTRLYQDLYDKQVTLQMSQGRGLGIADLLVRQLAPGAATPAAGAAAESAAAESTPVGIGAGVAAPRPRLSNPKLGTAAMLRSYEAAAAPGARAAAAAALAAPVPAVATAPAPAPYAGATGAVDTAGSGAVSRRFADSPADFVRKVLPHARAAAAELGVPAEAIVAQAALETGWGRHVPAAADGTGHNLFGIKAGRGWTGARLERATLEVEGGVPVATQAAFRAYESVAAGFRDYVQLLRTSDRYAAVRAAGEDPARFARALQASGYATDPHYARKLLQIVDGSTLRESIAATDAADPAGAPPARIALKTAAARPIA
jgi:flagellar protein FlgJ